MNFQNSKNPSPSQLFEQERSDLNTLFEEEPQLPKQIGRYQIKEELGRGGMGCVYKAFDPQMNKFIALKVILGAAKIEEKVVQRFVREAKAMAKMNHPNIVRIYDIGEENRQPFLTMDYIEGVSLKKFLINSSLNIRLFSKLMIKVASAITYAHEKGLVHRDLKPDNIMLGKNNEPQVMDFGLVKLVQADIDLSKKGVRNYQKAIANYSQAIALNPKYLDAYQNRGVISCTQ